MIGAAAAAANLLLEFNIPEKKEANVTNNKNGKVILVNSIAKLNFSKLFLNPGAIKLTKNGINISANKTKINKNINIKHKTSSAKLFAEVLLFNFSSWYDGINAALNVPSANNLLNVFGRRNATKNASAYIEVPIKKAINISLKYPRILLIRVKKLNTDVDANKFIIKTKFLVNNSHIYYILNF